MLVQSHKKMSEIIYHNIEDYTDFSLNKLRFKTGNMSPDLPFYHSHLKHYKSQNFIYIMRMIDDVSNINPYSNVGALNIYSYKLGVIAHYVCDYFCLPHYDRGYYQDHLGEHLIYEKDLHKRLKHYHNLKYLKKIEILEICDGNLSELFDDLIDKYLSTNHSFDNDIKYAITAASAICSVIILRSLKANEINYNL